MPVQPVRGDAGAAPPARAGAEGQLQHWPAEALAALTPVVVIVQLQRLGVDLCCDGGRLVASVPPGVLDVAVREQITHREPELRAVLALQARGHGPASLLMPIQPQGLRQAFYPCPGHNGDVFCFVSLAQHLGADQPLHVLQPPGLDGHWPSPDRGEDLAALFVDALVTFQLRGAFRLGGICHRGTIAFEVARQLRARRRQVELLVRMGSDCPTARRPLQRAIAAQQHLKERMLHHLTMLRPLRAGQRFDYIRDRLRAQQAPARPPLGDEGRHRFAVASSIEHAFHDYRQRIRPAPGNLTLLVPSRSWLKSAASRPMDWARYAEGRTTTLAGPDHGQVERMLLEPDVRILARPLRGILDRCLHAPTGALDLA